MQISFGIGAWSAWVGGLDSTALAGWSGDPAALSDLVAYPVPEWVPKMQRRRLSPLAKILLSQADSLPGCEKGPTIFGSRHGDLGKTLELLQAVVEQEPLSPTLFALSVHNAVSGQFSIFTGNTRESSLVSAGRDTLHMSLIQAVVKMQAEDLSRIWLLIADLPLPQPYSEHADEEQVPYAVGLELLRTGKWQVNRQSLVSESFSLPQPVQLVHALARGEAAFGISGLNQCWNWHRG